MKLYHARFKGHKINDPTRPLGNHDPRDFQLIVVSDSIHNVKSRIEDRYHVVSSFCVSDLEAMGLDNYLIEIN